MRQILESYFEIVDQEAFEALWLIAVLPFALLIWSLDVLAKLTKATRERAGRWLLKVAVHALPHRSIVREQTIALLRERRTYERYTGWCDLTRTGPLSFNDWRREQAWLVWLERKMRVAE